MKIACLMMQKNEGKMLETWVKYHSSLFGSENLYIFDNGSDDPETISILSSIRNDVNLDIENPTFADFERKGDIFLAKVRQIEAASMGHEYFIFLDCDEFIVATDAAGNVDLSPGSVQQVLEALPRNGAAKYIRGTYLNHPTEPDSFYFKPEKKSIFEAGSLKSLDIGFHNGQSFNGQSETARQIVYLHFHNRPYASLVRSARQKLSGRVKSFSHAALTDLAERRGRGHHLVKYLLSSEEEVMARMGKEKWVSFPFKAQLEAVGADYPHRKEVEEAQSKSSTAAAARPSQSSDFPEIWLNDGAVRFDFGIPGVVAEEQGPRRVPVRQNMFYSKAKGFGWLSAEGLADRQRNGGVAAHDNLVLGTERAIFRALVEPGFIHVRIVTGDLDFDDHQTMIQISDHEARIPIVVSRLREFTVIETTVDLRGPILDITFDSPIGNWVVNEVTLSRVQTVSELKIERRFRPFDPESLSQWPDFPLKDSIPETRLTQHIADTAGLAVAPTEVRNQDYLRLISGIVDFFVGHQAINGAIIDPARAIEFQYSTPYFGYCAALLVRHAGRKDLVTPAIAAIDHAVRSLVTRTAANAHEDFFALAIAHALPLIEAEAPAGRMASWREQLSAMRPELTYRCPAGARDRPGSNWNCLASAGELALARLGIRQDTSFADYSIKAQGRFFDRELGLYKEGPMVYDIFPRAWLADAVAGGYAGPAASSLARGLELGALTSLFLQSPNGGLLNGGRSAHHLWADALQLTCFEFAAQRALAASRPTEAGIFKRAARRAFQEIARWVQPTGQLWIVKNRGQAAKGAGYETYSSESQYNLAAAMAIALGYEISAETEAVKEYATPAEAGRRVLRLPRPIPKTVVQHDGGQAVITHLAEDGQTPAGITRIQFLGIDDRLGVMDGTVRNPGYRLPSGLRRDIAVGIQWREKDRWMSASALKPSEFQVELQELAPVEGRTMLELTYLMRKSGFSYREIIGMGRDSCVLSWDLPEGPEFHVVWPILCSDLRETAEISLDGRQVVVHFGGERAVWSASQPIALGSELVPHRNGQIRVASFPCHAEGARNPSLSLSVRPATA